MDVGPTVTDNLNVGLTLEEALIITVWVEVLLYGIYTCLFFESSYIMFKKGLVTRKSSAKLFFSAAILMYCVATTHIAVNLYRLLRAYVWLKETVGFAAYYADPNRWDNIANNVLLCLMIWIGDSLAIYRCFIVWNRNYYVIAIPSAIVLSSIILNIIVLCWADNLFSAPPNVRQRASNSIYPLAFAQNTLTTSFIAFRIIKQYRTSTASGVHNVGPSLGLIHVVRIFVESAILYPTELLMLIILFELNNNAQYILQGAVIPSVGIVFNLIAVRVHLARSETLQLANRTSNRTLPGWLKGSESSSEPGASQIQADVQFNKPTKLDLSSTVVLRDHLTVTTQ